jgi:hypothetical protein
MTAEYVLFGLALCLALNASLLVVLTERWMDEDKRSDEQAELEQETGP